MMELFFCEYSYWLIAVNYFSKNALSQFFEWVLNMPQKFFDKKIAPNDIAWFRGSLAAPLGIQVHTIQVHSLSWQKNFRIF